MPDWSKALLCALALGAVLLGVLSLGCNATCIRDSDCLGDSICSENRCLLLSRRDAGSAAPTDDLGDGAGGSAGSGSGGAAGSDLQGPLDAGN